MRNIQTSGNENDAFTLSSEICPVSLANTSAMCRMQRAMNTLNARWVRSESISSQLQRPWKWPKMTAKAIMPQNESINTVQ